MEGTARSKLTCDELEGLGDLRLVGVGFGNSTHFGGIKRQGPEEKGRSRRFGWEGHLVDREDVGGTGGEREERKFWWLKQPGMAARAV